MGKTFKILSIDGGGIRGVVPATFLIEIEKRTGKPIYQLFDLIAGTSTGGILALGLTKPGPEGGPEYRVQDVIRLYSEEGAQIFQGSVWRKVTTIANLADEKYPKEPFEAVLERYFGDARLKDALTNVLITSYEIEHRIPWFFRSARAQKYPDYDFPMKWVARAAAAAPTFFEVARLATDNPSEYYALVDGGVFANNPAMCAYAEGMANIHRNPNYDDVLLLSLGTGEHTRPIPYDAAKDWGLIAWARPLIDMLMHGVSETVHYQLNQILPRIADEPQRYYRFQVRLTEASDNLDDTSHENVRSLAMLAEDFIRENEDQFDGLCQRLVEH